MTSESLALFAGVLLSLFLSYFPIAAGWYEKLDARMKSLVFLGLLALGSAVSFGLACAGISLSAIPKTTCDAVGLTEVLNSFVTAMIAGAGTYVTTKNIK